MNRILSSGQSWAHTSGEHIATLLDERGLTLATMSGAKDTESQTGSPTFSSNDSHAKSFTGHLKSSAIRFQRKWCDVVDPYLRAGGHRNAERVLQS